MNPLEFKMESKSTLIVNYHDDDCALTYHTRHNGKCPVSHDSLEEAIIDSTMWITTGDLVKYMYEITDSIKDWLREDNREADEYGAPREQDFQATIERQQDAYSDKSDFEGGNIA